MGHSKAGLGSCGSGAGVGAEAGCRAEAVLLVDCGVCGSQEAADMALQRDSGK